MQQGHFLKNKAREVISKMDSAVSNFEPISPERTEVNLLKVQLERELDLASKKVDASFKLLAASPAGSITMI